MRGADTVTLQRFCAVVTLLATTTVVPCAAASLSTASRIGPRGVGPVVIGTTPAALTKAGVRYSLGQPARGSSCSYLVPSAPAGLRFLVEDGNVRRAEVLTPSIATTDGLRVGDPASAVVTRYRQRAHKAPDKYDPRKQQITITPSTAADAPFRIVFNVRDGTIASIFAGALPQIAYVEGCS